MVSKGVIKKLLMVSGHGALVAADITNTRNSAVSEQLPL